MLPPHALHAAKIRSRKCLVISETGHNAVLPTGTITIDFLKDSC
jgi:hypothetical protein